MVPPPRLTVALLRFLERGEREFCARINNYAALVHICIALCLARRVERISAIYSCDAYVNLFWEK